MAFNSRPEAADEPISTSTPPKHSSVIAPYLDSAGRAG